MLNISMRNILVTVVLYINIINRLVEVTILALNVNIMFSIILHHLPKEKVRKILRKNFIIS